MVATKFETLAVLLKDLFLETDIYKKGDFQEENDLEAG
jgi:hypothetical protein